MSQTQTQNQGLDMGASAPFRPGERIAVDYLPIAKIENNVAILSKAKPKLTGACGAKTEATVTMPFFVRGGFKVIRTSAYKIPKHYIHVRYTAKDGWKWERWLPERDIYLHELPDDINKLAEFLVKRYVEVDVKSFEVVKVEGEIKQVDAYIREFKHIKIIYPISDYFWNYWWTLPSADVKAPFYAVYEFVSPDEAKLVDDISRIDYIAMFTHYGLEDRRFCANLKIYGDIVWADTKSACCARESTAVGGLIAKFGSKVYIAKRNTDKRYEVEEWVMEFPPRRVAMYYADKTEPIDVPEQEVV